MKSLTLGLLLLALSAEQGLTAASFEEYFPLHVGNSWTYTGPEGAVKEFTIIGTKVINEYTYYQFDDAYQACGFPGWQSEGNEEGIDLLFRYDTKTAQVLQYSPLNTEPDIVRFDFSGEMWGAYGNQLVETDIGVTVPAGTFEDGLRFEYGMLVDCGVYHETLAPELGTVEFYLDGTFQLASFIIVPEPSSGAVVCVSAVSLLISAICNIRGFKKGPRISRIARMKTGEMRR